MHTLVLSTGSNLGSRLENLESALEQIEKHLGEICKSSSIYESPSWGYESKNPYYNQCIQVRTEKGLNDCLDLIHEIEESYGRLRGRSGYQDRRLDIDILFYNDIVVDRDILKVPHPRIQDRKFVLLPLAEIMPDLEHPVLHKTMLELLDECEDPLEVIRIN